MNSALKLEGVSSQKSACVKADLGSEERAENLKDSR